MKLRFCCHLGMAVLSLTIFGCSAVKEKIVNSQMMTEHLQTISAGHTGCMPHDNEISIVSIANNGSGVWTAVCRGKQYLCSSAGGTKGQSFSCAPSVK
ncbi:MULTISPECIES: hypothetical protein [unclassified Microbulbifer]|uniref:hypothetical protein n=1 Tax=unclassified Microbulbifer TaxID=2619833 RepID=UPI0027E567CE|nr:MULTISPECIES: hypothetical protein [unclassified Microbulbifer]